MLISSLLLLTLASLVFAAPEVTLRETTLVGHDVSGLKQHFFGGIPFAEPPIGNLRLQPPVLKLRPTNNSSQFDATNFGPACLQKSAEGPMSEDCLTINIFRPSGTTSDAKLPVLFWTYGGGFVAGKSSDPEFNGSAIVARSVARVTAFGESAGAIMTSILYFNSSLSELVRGVILESGSPASTLTFNAERREIDWQHFVSGVPSCAGLATSGNTFACLRAANSSDIFQGVTLSLSLSPELFPFDATLDGPGGLYPDLPSRLFAKGQFAQVPLITGTNLDEGTIFTPSMINSEQQVRDFLIANFSPPIVSAQKLANTMNKLMESYPDIPALGSPFNTGNETFELSSVYKQAAALYGDIPFQAGRRNFNQVAAKAGLKTYGYLFTEPQPMYEKQLGVFHGSEIPFVYGRPNTSTATSLALSSIMVDYWVSFATSLDPNDGLGVPRPQWNQYTTTNQMIMQLNGANSTVIQDDDRQEQIAFINDRELVFHHRRQVE